MFEQDAAVAVHDRLRQPGRARRIEHVERMVGRDLGELRAGLGDELVPAHDPSSTSPSVLGSGYGTTTVACRVGSPARIAANSSWRDTV